MKNFKYYILSFSLIALTLSLFSQNITVNGEVHGIDGAIEKAKVFVVNHSESTLTDANGNFTIKVPAANSQLTIKHKGASKTITLENGLLSNTILLVPSEKKLYKTIAEREELRLCDIYIKHYNDGTHINEVKNIQEKAFFIEAYNIAAAKFSDTALQNYLKLYPNGVFVEKANDAIEIASWQQARFNNTIDAYEKYLSNYPNGKATEMAKQKIADLQK